MFARERAPYVPGRIPVRCRRVVAERTRMDHRSALSEPVAFDESH